jgi:hypothetical protein
VNRLLQTRRIQCWISWTSRPGFKQKCQVKRVKSFLSESFLRLTG